MTETFKNIMVKLFSIAFILLAAHSIKAQTMPPQVSTGTPLGQKLYFGGNFGAEFGRVTYVELSPLVGYKFSEKFSAGPGISYIYYRDRDYNYSTSVYGVRAFARFFVLENVFAHAEYEALNLGVPDLYGDLNRQWIGSFLVGGGYKQSVGASGGITMMILWNLNETYYSPYQNPVIRMGFIF